MTTWQPIYRKVSSLLLGFWGNQKNAPGKRLYQLLSDDIEFKNSNNWLEDLHENYKLESLDPIQLFLSFSGSKQTDSKRVKNINDILRLLGSSENHQEIDFTGCPTPIKIKVNSARSPEQQSEIWNCFRRVAKNGRGGLTAHYFSQSRNWYGIELSSFTIFLFWIDPVAFVPLDTNTLDYLNSRKITNKRPRTFNEYLDLLDNVIKFGTIPDIVAKAYTRREQFVTRPAPYQQLIPTPSKIQDTVPNHPDTELLHDFRVLGLELYEDENKKLKKVLKKGRYLFYKCFEFTDGEKVEYYPNKDLSIYGTTPRINLSAIVGTNGSGKSTITELIYAGINNFAKEKSKFSKKLVRVNELFMDLYFKSDSVYRIKFRGKLIQLYRYSLEGTTYINPKLVPTKDFDFDQFFYTIGVNYSHYALNSLHMGEWIDNLFHKNDGYQAPLVINPFRKHGNIDINREYSLVRSRLLSNLLERVPVAESGDQQLSDLRLLGEGKSATTLVFGLNKRKFGKDYTYDKRQFKLREEDKEWADVIAEIYEVFNIDNTIIPKFHEQAFPWPLFVHNYLLRKLINISIRYDNYNKFFDFSTNKFKDVGDFLKAIRKDPSHITFKFKQAVNFLKFHQEYTKALEWDGRTYTVDIEKLSVVIETIKIDNTKEKYTTVELIPPSFLDSEVILTGDQFFRDLSSGEKQKIYTVSSLVYHLINLNSIEPKQRNFVRYRYINVVFDEVELYFHPEMQREFINYLIEYLKRVELEFSALNFQFITHSPFILSDIPLNNILFLNPKTEVVGLGETLGANIHDMLASNFFLSKGYMGEFTKNKIKSLAEFLKKDQTTGWDEALARNFIDAIGEPLIKDRLNIMFQLRFSNNIDQQIKDLEIKLNRLKSEKNK